MSMDRCRDVVSLLLISLVTGFNVIHSDTDLLLAVKSVPMKYYLDPQSCRLE